MASENLHEEKHLIKPETIDRHRAIASIMEELEAVDWYDQRVDATKNDELRAILAHNRDEEKEHAAMGIEWLRRNDAKFDEELRTYLFTEGDILAAEESATNDADGPPEASEDTGDDAGDGSLGIGSLKGA